VLVGLFVGVVINVFTGNFHLKFHVAEFPPEDSYLHLLAPFVNVLLIECNEKSYGGP
jgi:hypothetical protein